MNSRLRALVWRVNFDNDARSVLEHGCKKALPVDRDFFDKTTVFGWKGPAYFRSVARYVLYELKLGLVFVLGAVSRVG